MGRKQAAWSAWSLLLMLLLPPAAAGTRIAAGAGRGVEESTVSSRLLDSTRQSRNSRTTHGSDGTGQWPLPCLGTTVRVYETSVCLHCHCTVNVYAVRVYHGGTDYGAMYDETDDETRNHCTSLRLCDSDSADGVTSVTR